MDLYMSSSLQKIFFLSVALAFRTHNSVVSGELLSSICDTAVGWKVVLDEDFHGQTLNSSVWTARYSDEVGHGNELQSYIPPNARVENGLLVIETDRENHLDKNYTSAWIDTQGKFHAQFGRICVRANFPAMQPGFWPAHWLMPAVGACWPGPGEVDLMEMINGDGVSHGSYHYSPQYAKTRLCYQNETATATGVQSFLDLATFSAGFHEYAVEWDAGSLTYYVDGVRYITSYPVNPLQDGVPQVPMYLILNSALGGSWAGNPTAETRFPIKHLVDYVRVLQRDSEPSSHAQFLGTSGAELTGRFDSHTSNILEQRRRWRGKHHR